MAEAAEVFSTSRVYVNWKEAEAHPDHTLHALSAVARDHVESCPGDSRCCLRVGTHGTPRSWIWLFFATECPHDDWDCEVA